MHHLTINIENDIATLCFDREGAAYNIFDEEVLLELDSALHIIEENHLLKGLIIQSLKPNIFIAGADIKTLCSAPLAEIENLIHLGQAVFDRLANLKITTVAAIHGACAGGGYELALACDWRVATTNKATKIGLPEVQLGLLPAWGGSTRLPSLIGLPKALSAILSGKLYSAKSAKHKNMVDALAPQARLTKLAHAYLKKGKRTIPLFWEYHNPISVRYIRRKAETDIYLKTKGHYPAPLVAVDVICKGILASYQGSLHYEYKGFMKLLQLPETKELIRLFFLSEKQKKIPIVKQSNKKITTVAVIGSGVMGAGIAYWCATRNREVTLKDINDQALAKGMATIDKMIHTAVKRRKINRAEATHIKDRIFPTSKEINFYHKDIVIEAAVENLDVKKKIFSQLSQITNHDCILATNTSALPITELAKFNANPERVIGLHFFNPVPRMKLVEVVKTKYTTDTVLANAVRFVQQIGKLPVVVNDSPGFLVNRILMPYLVLAGEFFSNGANPREIDNKMLNFGMPMGPFRLLDEVGLDVALHVATTLADAFPDRMRVPRILNDLISNNCLGRKNGKGFYLYHTNSPELSINPIAHQFQEHTLRLTLPPEDQLIRLMSTEAQLCLDEGVAETADEIDFAMVMGTGYAPFRGGPLHYTKQNILQRKIESNINNLALVK